MRARYLAATDVLPALASLSGTTTALSDEMFHPLPILAEDDFLYRALGRMSRLESPYIGIADLVHREPGIPWVVRFLLADLSTLPIMT
jgi:hypothetical protein